MIFPIRWKIHSFSWRYSQSPDLNYTEGNLPQWVGLYWNWIRGPDSSSQPIVWSTTCRESSTHARHFARGHRNNSSTCEAYSSNWTCYPIVVIFGPGNTPRQLLGLFFQNHDCLLLGKGGHTVDAVTISVIGGTESFENDPETFGKYDGLESDRVSPPFVFPSILNINKFLIYTFNRLNWIKAWNRN